jgi:hypothetical protein
MLFFWFSQVDGLFCSKKECKKIVGTNTFLYSVVIHPFGSKDRAKKNGVFFLFFMLQRVIVGTSQIQ